MKYVDDELFTFLRELKTQRSRLVHREQGRYEPGFRALARASLDMRSAINQMSTPNTTATPTAASSWVQG